LLLGSLDFAVRDHLQHPTQNGRQPVVTAPVLPCCCSPPSRSQTNQSPQPCRSHLHPKQTTLPLRLPPARPALCRPSARSLIVLLTPSHAFGVQIQNSKSIFAPKNRKQWTVFTKSKRLLYYTVGVATTRLANAACGLGRAVGVAEAVPCLGVRYH
jgi:hypothetical protein